MGTKSYTIAPGGGVSISGEGQTVAVEEATDDFLLTIYHQGGDESEFTARQGLVFHRQDFIGIRVDNPNVGNLTFKVHLSKGGVDARATFTGTINTQESKSATLQTEDDATLVADTATEVVAANSARRSVLINNKTGAALRVGDSLITMTRGAEVPNGASIEVETTGAVFCRSLLGGDVAVLEVLD